MKTFIQTKLTKKVFVNTNECFHFVIWETAIRGQCIKELSFAYLPCVCVLRMHAWCTKNGDRAKSSGSVRCALQLQSYKFVYALLCPGQKTMRFLVCIFTFTLTVKF